MVVDALRPADDLAVTLGREHVEPEHDLRILGVRLHVESLDRDRIARDHDRRVETLGERRLLVAAEVVAELHREALLLEDLDRLAVGDARETPGYGRLEL